MAGARSKARASGKYQAWYTDATGRTVYFTGTRSRPETLRIAQRLEDDALQVRQGYRPAPTSAAKHRATPFSDVATEYQSWGQSQGGHGGRAWASEHCRKVAAALTFWASELGLKTLADLDGILPRVESVARRLADEGRTGKTIQNRIQPLAALCRWAKQRGFLAADPLEGMGGFDTSPQTTRRALTPEEIKRLLDAAPPGTGFALSRGFVFGLAAW